MRNDVVFIVLSLASKRWPDAEIISEVHERVGVRIGLAEIETILAASLWNEAA